jgi:oligosaccharide 4-alpha-D-glucosyltransferase
MNPKINPFKLLIIAIILLISGAGFAQTYLGNVTSYAAAGNEVTIDAGSAAVRLIFYKPNLLRVDYLPTTSTTFQRSLVVFPDSEQQVAVSVAESDSTISVTTSALRVVCGKFPLRLSFYDSGNQFLLGEPVSGGLGISQSEPSAKFTIRPDECFYGTGERGLSLNLRGLAFDSYNQQHGGYPNGGIPPAMNVNIPFIVSSGHYGIYFDDTFKGHFDIGRTDPNVLAYSVLGGELSYYFIYDPTYGGILSDYTWLTGRAPLLPMWAYGYIQSKYGYRNYMDAEQTIQRFRADSIPADAIILDLYWFQNMGDLDWNQTDWPNPSQITAQFLSQGFKTIVITEPYIVQGSTNFATADQNGYLAKNSTGRSNILNNWWSCGCDAGLLDITNPAAQSWWWSKYQHIFQTGVSGLWTDLGEPERDSLGMQFHMGPDLQVHNIYDFLWAELLYNGFNQSFPNKRMFNLTRSGYAGIQRFGTVTWSGDVAKTFAGLAVQLPLLLNMGMSGIAYHNSDIGGFTGNQPTTPELYTRWMEFGAFCPVMRAHGYDGLGGTEPWAFNSISPSTEGIVRNIIRLRYSFMPYNYTTAHEAYETGMPLARPLIIEYPDDPNVTDETSAYMWGDNLLVAPVVQSGQTSNTFYLPAGKWISYWDDKVYSGGGTVTVPAPVNEVPLLVKAGSIIPMQPAREYTGQYPSDTLCLGIYPDPGVQSTFTLYEDDGESLAYQSGAFSETAFSESMTQSGGSGSMEVSIGASVGSYDGKPARRTYICEIHKVTHEPVRILFHGTSIVKKINLDSLGSSSSGFFYDGVSGVLYVKIDASTDSSYSLEIDSLNVTGTKGSSGAPSGYKLNQNFPNPFNPSTTLSYELASRSLVRLRIYDVLGREVATLVNGEEGAGSYTAVFDGRGLTSGVYFYVLTAGSFRKTREMVLLK